jgi:hypothetical protein
MSDPSDPSNPSDASRIASSSQPACAVGRYDRFQEAGKATRFVKGTSGNPNGRRRKLPNEAISYERIFARLRG